MKRPIVAVMAVMTICAVASTEEIRPGVFRTPDERFENLPGYDFEPHYIETNGYRMHYLDEGPSDGEVVLLLPRD